MGIYEWQYIKASCPITSMNEQVNLEKNPTGILSKSILGGSWLSAGYVIEKILATLSFFILARLLSPSDFGVIAIILLVPKLFQSISEPGFARATIQREGSVDQYLDAIWTIRILKSIGIAILVWILSPWIGALFHADAYVTAIRLGGLFIVIQNVGNIGEIYFFKNLDFKKLVFRNIAKQFAYVFTAVSTALITPSYWALFAGMTALYSVEALSTYILHPYRPRLSFRFRNLIDLVPFGKWVMGQGIVDQVYGFLENATVGYVTNVTSVGFYTKAKSLAGVVPGFLTAVISVVSFPVYAKLRDEPQKLRDGMMKSFHLIWFFTIPAIVLFWSVGGKLILMVLGSRWLPMTETLRLFLIYFGLGTGIDVSFKLLSGIGQPDKEVKLTIIKTIVTLGLLFVLTPKFGIVGTASALVIGLLPSVLLTLRYLKRYVGLTTQDVLSTMTLPLTVSIIIFLLPVLFFRSYLMTIPDLPLIGLAVLGISLYLVFVFEVGKHYRVGPYETIKVILRHIQPKDV